MPQQWNSATTSTNLVLSNNNLTATNTSPASGSWQGAIGLELIASGTRYWEISFPVMTNGNSQIGVASITSPVTDNFLGAGSDSIGINSGGTGFSGGNNLGIIGPSWVAGDRVAVQLSMPGTSSNKTISLNNLTTASGWSTPYVLSPTVYVTPIGPAAGVGNSVNVDSFIGYFAPSTWLGTPQTDFGPWDMSVWLFTV